MNAPIPHLSDPIAARAAEITAELAAFQTYNWHGTNRYHHEDIFERLFQHEDATAKQLQVLIARCVVPESERPVLSDADIGRLFGSIVRRCIRDQAEDDIASGKFDPLSEVELEEDAAVAAAEQRWEVGRGN